MAFLSRILPIFVIVLAPGSAATQPCTPLVNQIPDGQIQVQTSVCPTILGTATPFPKYAGSYGNPNVVPPFPVPYESVALGSVANSASQVSNIPASTGLVFGPGPVIGGPLRQSSSSLGTTSSRSIHLTLPSPQMGTNPAQNPGPQPVPTGQQAPSGPFLNPMSENMNPLGSAPLWKPSGNAPVPLLVTGGPTAVSGQSYSVPPSGNIYPSQTGLSNGQLSATNALITLSNGLVVIPAVTVSLNGAEPALQLPNSALISAGGLPAVVSGTTYSILPSNQGLLINGASTLRVPELSSTSPSLPIFTVGGQAFTASPGGFPLASTSVLPGGTPFTISGTVVSLGQGALRIGSATMTLAAAPSHVLTVGDQIFTAAPNGFNIGSTRIFPGSQTVTVSGTHVFLDASSHLQIGSSAVDLGPGGFFPSSTTSSTSSLNLDLITSTMTTLPPGFYTEVPTSTTLVGNMWLTTEQGGHSTIVPVVGGTILWNLPEIPHVTEESYKSLRPITKHATAG
ncbi:hypothetical protein OEA41_010285 [Lepraria neglecta]|uniref:Uncharacterized protein n=1 Tax=Lepraria neglecta TaxID=209136 RepID=A0AAD9YW50_9LECA|nr:hypothetical protein OEA41_010285 [Lepraria neglecta]